MIPEETMLNSKNITSIVRKGYSRIPIYANGDRNQVSVHSCGKGHGF